MPGLIKLRRGTLQGPYFKPMRTSKKSISRSLSTPHDGFIATDDYVDSRLRQVFNLSSEHTIFIGDENYYLPSEEEIRHIITTSNLHHRNYYPDRYDCDDFAFVLKGEFCLHSFNDAELQYSLCAGMMWGEFSWVAGVHAINWVLISPENEGDEANILLIEPQTDTFYQANEYSRGMSLLLV